MQCWSKVLEANKSYSVYSGHITMPQSHKLSQLAPGHECCIHLLFSTIIQKNLIDIIYCQKCFLLQHLGLNNMQKTHPTICVLLHWMVPTRQVSEVLLGSIFSANWDLLLWAHHFKRWRKKGLLSVLNVYLTKALRQWSSNYWFYWVWKRHWKVLMNKQ